MWHILLNELVSIYVFLVGSRHPPNTVFETPRGMQKEEPYFETLDIQYMIMIMTVLIDMKIERILQVFTAIYYLVSTLVGFSEESAA